MGKIAFLARRKELAETAQKIALKKGMELMTVISTPERCIETAEYLVAEQYDVLLVRGGFDDILKNAKLPINLVRCETSAGEYIDYLTRAKRISGKENPNIVSVGLPSYNNLDELQQIVGARIDTLFPKSVNHLKTLLNSLFSEKSIDVFTCSTSYFKILEETGVPTCLHQSVFFEESIELGLETARVIISALDAQRKTLTQMNDIISHSFDAILYINQKGIVKLGNLAAEQVFNIRHGKLQGHYLWEIVPTISEKDTFAVLSGDELVGRLIKSGEYRYVTNASNLKIDGEFQGAVFHFKELSKMEAIENSVRNELIEKGFVAHYCFSDIISSSKPMIDVKNYASQFAQHDSTVLIFGESGTGKELFAQSIHKASLRSEFPFVAVNCAALHSGLLESELFGYVGGAFTGAGIKGKRGLFEVADKGTLFLDEISEMDMVGQTKLLRVLAEKTITRVGDNTIRPIDVRIIAATNRNLGELIDQGHFRKDLYYRLNVLTLSIPPLRDKPADIVLLFNHYFRYFCNKEQKLIEIDAGVEKVIAHYNWPGNVRQLRNFCERLVIICTQRKVSSTFVQEQLISAYPFSSPSPSYGEHSDERARIVCALAHCGGIKKETADILGISTSTLWRKMKYFGL